MAKKYGDECVLAGKVDEDDVCRAVMALYQDGEIDLYGDDKATESDFDTYAVNWSEYEERSADEIFPDDEFERD